MAIIHRASLRPTKVELLDAWLPGRPWYRGPREPGFERVTAFRFDDPAGEVGVETLIVRSGDGPLIQVPLTYRAEPLDSAADWLVGTTEHSVLGTRWVYDGCGDPVYAATLAATIFGGGGAAQEFVEVDGEMVAREVPVTVRGSGSGPVPAAGGPLRVDDGTDRTVIHTGAGELTVLRYPDAARSTGAGRPALTAAGPGLPGELLLATAG